MTNTSCPRHKKVIAIIGRPNVGKSTLFNRLTRARAALVADEPGVTRDINIGTGRVGDAAYLVIDTGGIDSRADNEIKEQVSARALETVADADALVLMVDAAEGLTSEDRYIAGAARKAGKPLFLAANKADRKSADEILGEFNELGVGAPYLISALRGFGVTELVDDITGDWPGADADEPEASESIRVAVIGRPNVGKSTLVNRMLGEERMLTADFPGTTHDSIETAFERRGESYTLIDTAGLRRRARVHETVEKFSVVKALQAIDLADVVVVVIDATETVTEQDLHLIGLVVDSGRSLVVAVNKWDGLDRDQRALIVKELDRRLRFVGFAERLFVSALHGTGVGDLFDAINRTYASVHQELTTGRLNDLLEQALRAHQPPLVRGRRAKLRYAHLGGKNPPKIIIHGSSVDALPDSYRRYLMNYFREALGVVGATIRVEFRRGDNPFAGKRNELTPRQLAKRQRLRKHSKRKG